MVRIIEKNVDGRTYYYLRHHVGSKEKEEYLGTSIPNNIEEIKQNFVVDFYRKDWIPNLDSIKKGWQKYKTQVGKSVVLKDLHQFSISNTYSTQKIEGSTLTKGETFHLLENNYTPTNRPMNDVLEAQLHQKIFKDMLEYEEDITEKQILKWHDELFSQTESDQAGVFRKYDVGVYGGKTEYVLGSDVEEEVKKLLKWYNKNKTKMNPVELAARFHKRFELIHPFGNGNGRIGRLLMNFILYKNGFPMLDIEPKEKMSYINALERSYLKNDEMVFVKWFMKRYLKANKKFLK